MANKLADVIKKVNKLLRVASSSDKPGEIAAAQSLAQELITKYQIEEAQLNDHVGTGEIISKIVTIPKPYFIDKVTLLHSIAIHNFCKVLRAKDHAIIYGYESDIELCLTLYDTLSLHMVSEMKRKLKTVSEQDTKGHIKTWIKSFFGGYALNIGLRIKDSKARTINEATSISTSVALVIRDKQHAIEEYFQDIPRSPGHRRKLTSEQGYKSGMESAKTANINQATIEE